MKQIESLIPDTYSLFLSSDHKVNRENLAELLKEIEQTVLEYLETAQTTKRVPKLRLSMIGTPDRKLWYEFNYAPKLLQESPEAVEEVDLSKEGPAIMRFFMGSLLEHILMFLFKEAGHSVTHQQETVKVDDVEGHNDGVVDGVLVDVKTASDYAYKKFASRDPQKLIDDDPFGYVGQISGYYSALKHAVLDNERAVFIVFNKSKGELCLAELPVENMIDPEARIKRIKEVLEMSEPPEEKCYEPVPVGASGNKELAKGCQFCPFKFNCWSDTNEGQGLRVFEYQNGWKFLTQVEREPTVPEVELF